MRPECHFFLDWKNWCFGMEFRFGASKHDPLNQYFGVLLMFGPAIIVLKWLRRLYDSR